MLGLPHLDQPDRRGDPSEGVGRGWEDWGGDEGSNQGNGTQPHLASVHGEA